VQNLIINIPQQKPKAKMDLVLEGGAFNGSYMVGSLILIKNLENRGDISVDRISGASIGAILAVVYKMNLLEFSISFYKEICQQLKNHSNLTSIEPFCYELERRMSPDFYIKMRRRLYISFHDLKKGKKVVKSSYKSNGDIITSLLKSSYIPFLCGKTYFFQGRYLDGLLPYIFPLTQGKKVLYIDLLNMRYKAWNMFQVKKEKTNTERIMVGILDAYYFFFNQRNTETCYYLANMEWKKQFYHFIKKLFEYIFFLTQVCVYFCQENISVKIRKKSVYTYLYGLIMYFKTTIIQQYCI